jgi:hypothetical protein
LKLKPTVERLIDNNVIEHADFQDPDSLGQPAGQPDISIAACRIVVYAACGITGAMPYLVLCRIGG